MHSFKEHFDATVDVLQNAGGQSAGRARLCGRLNEKAGPRVIFVLGRKRSL